MKNLLSSNSSLIISNAISSLSLAEPWISSLISLGSMIVAIPIRKYSGTTPTNRNTANMIIQNSVTKMMQINGINKI